MRSMSEMESAAAKSSAYGRHGGMDQSKARRQMWAIPRAACRWHQRLVQRASFRMAGLFNVLVVASVALVHVSAPCADEAGDAAKLPPHVADLRDVILTAAHSGKIEELKAAFDVSGSVPDLGIPSASDPIKALKDASEDHQGRDILAALIQVFEMPPATLPLGSDIENNLIYVWPYLAERPIDKLTPSEEVDLYRLVTPAKAGEMREKKRWLWWRLVIAADGTWTVFKKSN
jgi:hypothetical protein